MKKVKFLIPTLLMFCPYMILLTNFFRIPKSDSNLNFIFLTLYFLILLTILIINIIYSCTRNQSEYYKLALFNMIIKIIHIPFYIVIFLIATSLSVLLSWMVGPFILVFIIISAVLDYLLLLTSSSYGINALIRSLKTNHISTRFLVINIILHFIFVLDVLSSIVVFFKLRKIQLTIDEENQNYNRI